MEFLRVPLTKTTTAKPSTGRTNKRRDVSLISAIKTRCRISKVTYDQRGLDYYRGAKKSAADLSRLRDSSDLDVQGIGQIYYRFAIYEMDDLL